MDEGGTNNVMIIESGIKWWYSGNGGITYAGYHGDAACECHHGDGAGE